MVPALPVTLFLAAVLALWVALRVSRQPGIAARPFVWLTAAVALWCTTSGAHALADTVATKLLWSKLEYVGIAMIAPLWLMFTATYAGLPWFAGPTSRRGRLARAAYWVMPVATIVIAATNDWHQALWTGITLQDNGLAVYAHGWWFWTFVAYSYVLLAVGTLVVARDLRRSPPSLRGQFRTLIAAALVPWAGNVLYLTSLRTLGFDPTPLAFTASSALFAWALYRSHLFDLVPVARDVVIESLSDGMIVLDPARRILDMNAAACELIHRHGTWFAGGRWVGQPIDAALPMLAKVNLQSGAPEVIVTRSGPRLWFDVRVVPVRWSADGQGACWAVLLRDVTVQRRAAAERDALHERMQEQQRRESLSVLAAGLAHDFNNLLTGIVGNADLLAMQVPASSSMGHSVGAILLGAQRAADLVSKMLAYAGERHGSISRIDMDVLTRDLLELLRASAARHCTITYRGAPVRIDADPTQVRQVAMNLIINATEAVSDSGQVSVSVGRQPLTTADLSRMRVGQEVPPGDYAFLEVSDNGCGIDEATMRRLFQPFFTTKASGHGLGLAAVQGIVMGHRGALRVESRAGEGARFTVWFPLATGPEPRIGVDDDAADRAADDGDVLQDSGHEAGVRL